jgi:polyketide synthase PksL
MGLTSSGLLDVVETISEKIGETLSPTLLFEYRRIFKQQSRRKGFADFFADRFDDVKQSGRCQPHTEQYGSHFSASPAKTEKPIVTQTENRRKTSVPLDESQRDSGISVTQFFPSFRFSQNS